MTTQQTRSKAEIASMQQAIVDPVAFKNRYFDREYCWKGDRHIDSFPEAIEEMRDLGRQIRDVDEYGAPRACKVAHCRPREHAKTVDHNIVKLWAALNGWRNFIVTIRESQSVYRSELTTYMRMIENYNPSDPYPSIVRDYNLQDWARRCARMKFPWSSDEIVIPNALGGYCMIKGASRGESIRGALFGKYRPDFVIGDDIDKLKEQRSPQQVEDLHTWLERDVLPLGSSAVIAFIGTILGPHSLLNWLIEDKGWKPGIRYGAIKEDGSPLWAQMHSLESLLAKREEVSSETWLAEWMNQPMDSANSIFPLENWMFYEDSGMPIPTNFSSFPYVILGVDTALSTKETADYTAIAPVAKDAAGSYHVGRCFRDRISSMDKTIDVIRRMAEEHSANAICIEDWAGSKGVIEGLRKCTNAAIRPMSPARLGDKETRARAATSPIEAGKVWTSSSYKDQLDELYTFPKAKHDDMVDAISYALIGHTKKRQKHGGVVVY